MRVGENKKERITKINATQTIVIEFLAKLLISDKIKVTRTSPYANKENKIAI